MDINGYIEQATARLQAEAGRFLILKEAILKLPSSDRRSSLLSTQNNLEQRVLQLMSKAAAFKEAASFKGLDALKMFTPDRINQLKTLSSDAARTIAEIQTHKAAVASATSNPSLNTAATSGAVTVQPLVKIALGVAAVAFAVNWVRRETRRRTR